MSKDPKHNKALREIEGVRHPESTDSTAINKIKLKRKKLPETQEFVAYLLKGDRRYLSRAITLIESTKAAHQKKATEIIKACLPYANKSIRIGITGVPGVGKSTFIEAFGKFLTSIDKKVAVLTIDPSSTVNKGSILGDKTRMDALVTDENAFIRPSPSGESLGGVARKTRESIVLCEAAGYDIVLIETVGVGQNETAVHSMVDFFLLLKLAGAGDELQGIKRGIIEMADAIVINKADGDMKRAAQLAQSEFTRALHLYPLKASKWQPKVSTCSALHNQGIAEIWQLINEYLVLTKESGYFNTRRIEQNKYWLTQTINQQLTQRFYSNMAVKKVLKEQLEAIEKGEISPFEAADLLLKLAEN